MSRRLHARGLAWLAMAYCALPWAVRAEEAEGELRPIASTTVTRSPSSPDDLYDFKSFAEQDPRYRALLEAHRRRQWATVVRLAGELTGNARPAVQQAAWMLQALALEAQKNPAEAERAWQRLAQQGPLAQRARWRLADLALARADIGGALAQLAAIAPWHADRDAAHLQMAELELRQGQTGPARDALERLRPEGLSRGLRARHALLWGRLWRALGQSTKATEQLRQAWLLDVEPHAAAAMSVLRELGTAPGPADQIERILRRREVKSGQLQAWLREAAAVTEEGSGLRGYVHGALWVRNKKTRDRGIGLLTKAAEQLTDPVLKARALFVLGDALGKAKRDADAIEVLKQIASLDVGADLQARGLERLHRLYKAVDQPAEAAAALEQLLVEHPAAEEKEVALWGLAWQKRQAGQHAEALQLLVQLEREFGQQWTSAQQPWRSKAMYWQGRCLQAMGQTEAALETWTQVAQTWPQAYYGIVALDRIRELAPEQAQVLQGPPPSPANAGVAPASLDRLRVLRSVELDEAVQLVRMGLPTLAQDVLKDQLGRGLPRDGVHLLATLYEVGGKQRQASGVMQRHTRRAARPDDSTARAWRQAFPLAFADEVTEAAQKAGIPRSLLYAVMRHESGYVPTATSKAGAYGLTQVLPQTARAVAELHGLTTTGAHGLYKPAYNLQVGGLYLAQLLSLGQGAAAVAIASYNAGPYAVKDWHKKWAGQATDAFVEAIPYPATRAYVMQVLASAQTYAWLYPEWGELDRDQLGRPTTVPLTPGPFMRKPAPSVSMAQ